MAGYVYVLMTQNKGGRRVTYVGWTLDLERRMAEHNGAGKRGAKSTRGRAGCSMPKSTAPAQSDGAGICHQALPRLPGPIAVALGYSGKIRLGSACMIFEQIATGGCQSYLLGCGDSHAAILIDPNLHQIDHYPPGGAGRTSHPLCAGYPHPRRSFFRGQGTGANPERAGGDPSPARPRPMPISVWMMEKS